MAELELPANWTQIPAEERFVAYHALKAPGGQGFDLREINMQQMADDGWADNPCKLGVQIGQSKFGEQVGRRAERLTSAVRDHRMPAFDETPEELEDIRVTAARAEEEAERLREINQLKDETHRRELDELFARLKTAKEEDQDLNLDALREAYLGPGMGVSKAAEAARRRGEGEQDGEVVEMQALYRRGTTAPPTPNGGTDVEHHLPVGWSPTEPEPTKTHDVWRIQREVLYVNQVFKEATPWATVVRVAQATGE